MLVGAHVSSGGGISRAVDRAEEIGAESIQVFTQNPRMWRLTPHPDAEVERFRARRAELGGLPVVAHAVYFLNLASDDDALYLRSAETLARTVETVTRLGGDGVVFHVGSHRGAGLAERMGRVVAGLQPALAALGDEVWLLVENSAGAGGTIGRDVDELAALVAAVDHPRLGLCLDTCHAFVSGVDVRDVEVVDAWLDHVDARIGLDRLRCVHVNDAAAPFGSNRDRHACVGQGEIGAGLGAMLSHPALQRLPAIIETAGPAGRGPDAAELDTARALRDRAALARRRG